jgi:hypothetical protein
MRSCTEIASLTMSAVNVPVADLQEVGVTGDNVALEVQVESAAAVVAGCPLG